MRTQLSARGAGCLLIAAVAIWLCAKGTALAASPQPLTLTTSFTPNELASPTNLSATLGLALAGGVPQPLQELTGYAPAGLSVDVRGLPTCAQATLERWGPRGCPVESRIGFGGGVGVLELAHVLVKEPYTLDFFLAPRERGQLTILIYAKGIEPISVQLVLHAKEVRGSAPYGFGLAVEVPPISTIPGAEDASVESGYVSLGGANVAYFRSLHGKRTLERVKGLIEPAKCPRGGFPFEIVAGFIGGATGVGTYASPCPAAGR
jgi:hypothetical protein